MQSCKSSSSESEVERSWLSLFDRIFANAPARRRLAAPFLSVPPAGYDPTRVPSILYVGKATAGNWWLSTYLGSRTVKERRQCTTDFLEKYVKTGEYSSAFWRFAQVLSERVAATTKSNIEPLQNFVWTNTSKIGVRRGNPTGYVFRAQSELAVESLRFEIKKYRPRLVVFVTGDYAAEVVDAVVRDGGHKTWHEERGRDMFWWREPIGHMPAILWAYHPERKPLGVLDAWLEQAARLVRMTA
jgi:hypothetical protein